MGKNRIRFFENLLGESENGIQQGKDAMKCDMCGQRKENVRPLKAITVGLKSGTVRTKFCDECAATVTK